MSKRGRKPKMPDATEAQITEIIELFKAGKSHSVIASEMDISESKIKQILANHGVRRSSRKFCGLTEEQDEDLLNYLKSQDSYQGTYRNLRTMMEYFATENEISCEFSQPWRLSFHKRHQDVLPPVIRTLLSLRPDQDDTEVVTEGDDSEPEPIEVSSVQEQETTVEVQEDVVPGAEETIEADEELYAAVQEAMQMYSKAGLTDERAQLLLRNMCVPGFAPPPSRKKSSKTKKLKKQKSIVPAATQATPSHMVHPIKNEAKLGLPVKKSPLQLRVLEREFLKSSQITAARAVELGEKLGLDADQVISWFRNKRHKRPAASRR